MHICQVWGYSSFLQPGNAPGREQLHTRAIGLRFAQNNSDNDPFLLKGGNFYKPLSSSFPLLPVIPFFFSVFSFFLMFFLLQDLGLVLLIFWGISSLLLPLKPILMEMLLETLSMEFMRWQVESMRRESFQGHSIPKRENSPSTWPAITERSIGWLGKKWHHDRNSLTSSALRERTMSVRFRKQRHKQWHYLIRVHFYQNLTIQKRKGIIIRKF